MALSETVVCGCTRSVGAVCALFAALATASWLAGNRCAESGGRVSDVMWVCEGPSGAASLWSLVAPLDAAIAFLVVGVPVYAAANALARRLMRGLASSGTGA
jgi:hypothetical protein